MLTNNPQRFWRVINPKNYPDITLVDEHGDMVHNCECADLLNNAFSSVFTHEDTPSSPSLVNLINVSMPEVIISEGEISCLLNKLRTSLVSDHNSINNKTLKSLSPSLSPILCALFSQSLSTKTIRSDWKVAEVIPIFKSGDPTQPLNYHPISLTSTICKLLEHVLYTEIINYLEDHNSVFE